MQIPISGEELLEYMTFLGKGQYFIRNGVPFFAGTRVLLLNWYNKHVTASFETMYFEQFGSNNFRDLEKNKYTTVIAPGEAMVYAKNNSFLFMFHDYIAISAKVVSRNPKNLKKAAELRQFVIESFDGMRLPRAAESTRAAFP